MGRVVLVTGAARDLGSRVLRLLHADPDVDLVVGVDVVPPRRDVGGAVFVRGDIRTPVVGRLIAEHGVDTVAHLGVLATPRAPAASRASVTRRCSTRTTSRPPRPRADRPASPSRSRTTSAASGVAGPRSTSPSC